MIDLPDFKPLKISQSSRRPTRASLDALDHVAVVIPAKVAPGALRNHAPPEELAPRLSA
jgi:hypothetical protein